MDRRPLLAWIALALAVAALRLPWILLPGLGRDEATYLVWSHHPEPAYAPLLQILLVLTRDLGAWVGPRLPSIVAGVMVAVLFERWLAVRGADLRARWVAVALVTLSPWQTYVGSILHPDDLQLAAVLGFVLAAAHGRRGVAVVLAGLAPWTKPSGLLLTMVALVWCARSDAFDRRGRVLASTAILLLAAPPLIALDATLVRGLLDFGSEGPGVAGRLAVFAVGTLVLAGPALPVVAARGVVRAWRGPRDLGTALGAVFVLAFGAAALVGGQVKANWMLPAVLLLWPVPLRWTRRTAIPALLLTAGLSVVITIGFVHPERARELEERWTGAPGYLDFAGDREAEVASARAWWHRLAEYRALSVDCPPDAPAIVSDDYGLAAQWAVRCPGDVPRLVLPFDPVFAGAAHVVPRGAVVLAVRRSIVDLIGDRAHEPVRTVPHPVTGAPMRWTRVTDAP